jgi:ribonuclease BN (tRNA processing enzyme)
MRLTVVGCAPAYTRHAGRASSCYLVEEGGRAIVLDLGQGAFAELGRYRPPESVAGVLVSHLHPDHLVDLVPLRHYLKHGLEPTPDAGRPAIEVRGPADLPARLDGLLGEAGFMPPLSFAPLTPGTLSLAGFDIEAGHVRHIADSYAFRVAGQSRAGGLVYSGDCAVADDLLPLIRPGDTLLCEASFGAGERGPMHLTAAQAASAAARGDAAQLVLTHLLNGDDEAVSASAAALYKGPVLVARPGLVVELG